LAKKSIRPGMRCGLATLGALATGCAMAQANPFYIGAAQGFTRDSNVFRVATGQPETADTFSTTSLLAGADLPFGRQRFRADLAGHHNKYRDNDQLDHTGYAATVGLDWETIERLSGRIGYTTNRSMAPFGADDGPALTTENLATTQEFVLAAQLGLVSLLSLQAAAKHRELDYSAVEYNYLELKQDSIEAGVLYRPSGLLTLGAAVRHTKGEYPFAVQTSPGVFETDEFDRNDFDLTASWNATGLSTLHGRLSYTKESHDVVGSRDLSGVTGALSWDYKPTAKLAFTTDIIRDTGAESAFSTVAVGGQTGSSSQLSSILQLRALYEATAKIRFDASARYVERELVNTFGLPSGALSTNAGSDRTSQVKLGVNYAPVRNGLLGCSAGRERRTSSSTVSYSYSANVSNCFVQFKLQ
jgi:hypothetical protein